MSGHFNSQETAKLIMFARVPSSEQGGLGSERFRKSGVGIRASGRGGRWSRC